MLDTSTLDGFVGTYQSREAGVMTISRDGPALFAQLTGQPRLQIYPQGPADFYYKAVDARISFVSDPPGSVSSLVLHHYGRDIPMPRIDSAVAQQFAANLAARIQNQTAMPGSETALRRTIAGSCQGSRITPR